MWWTLPLIVCATLLGIGILLCGTVCCVQRCFYPDDADAPLFRTRGSGNGDRSTGPASKFSWKGAVSPSPGVA